MNGRSQQSISHVNNVVHSGFIFELFPYVYTYACCVFVCFFFISLLFSLIKAVFLCFAYFCVNIFANVILAFTVPPPLAISNLI